MPNKFSVRVLSGLLLGAILFGFYGCNGAVSEIDPQTETKPVSEKDKQQILKAVAKRNKNLSNEELKRLEGSIGD
jgi:hypothetical protein